MGANFEVKQNFYKVFKKDLPLKFIDEILHPV